MSEDRVEAVERALTILDAFREGEESLSLAALAEKTGFYKSTILRLAASLERFGYLAREPNGLFRLGPSLWRLGSLYRRSFDLGEHLRPELRRLVEATTETASFYVARGTSGSASIASTRRARCGIISTRVSGYLWSVVRPVGFSWPVTAAPASPMRRSAEPGITSPSASATPRSQRPRCRCSTPPDTSAARSPSRRCSAASTPRRRQGRSRFYTGVPRRSLATYRGTSTTLPRS